MHFPLFGALLAIGNLKIASPKWYSSGPGLDHFAKIHRTTAYREEGLLPPASSLFSSANANKCRNLPRSHIIYYGNNSFCSLFVLCHQPQ